jgi:hypothetical protein
MTLRGSIKMINREYLKMQIDTLPEAALEGIVEYISFRKFHLGLFEDDTEYLTSIPGMAEIIQKGKATPLEECLDSVGWDIN